MMDHRHAREEYHTSAERRFLLSLGLTSLILVVEVAGGVWTGSLALLSDAAHILLDILALGMSYIALRLARLPPDDRHTYGFHRLQVLAALLNGATLLVVAFGIFREAWVRFHAESHVLAGPMLVVAVVGLVVNLLVVFVLREHEHDDLNVHSAFLHVLGDTLSSVGVIVGGVVILLTGWEVADPLVSVLIGGLILLSSGRVVRQALHILTEGTPEGIPLKQVRDAMGQVPGVSGVHDLHVWTVSPGFVALSAHVTMADQPLIATQDVQAQIRHTLLEQFGIEHTTIQVECSHCGQEG